MFDYSGSTTPVVDGAEPLPTAGRPSSQPIDPTMSETHQLGDLQLAIMRILWECSEATVAEVHAALQPERGLALTTIATMLSKMEKKGVVAHRKEGRQFVYQPTVSEGDVHSSMVSQLTERLFDGRPAALVNHLLKAGEIDAGELDEIKKLIESHKQAGA